MDKLKKLVSISTPTKTQIIRGVEIVVLTYALTFVTTLSQQPDPLNKAALLAASAAGIAAVYALVKSVLTDL